jgi:hypothetical protein
LIVSPLSACGLSRTENQPLKSTIPCDGIVTLCRKVPAALLTSKYWTPPPVGVTVGLPA